MDFFLKVIKSNLKNPYKKIEKMQRYILGLFFFLFTILSVSCSNENEETERSRVVRLLSDNSSKSWGIEKFYIDDVEHPISSCDSSFVQIINADFTWTDKNLNFNCGQPNEGTWELNDANNVLTTFYVPFFTADTIQLKLEIMELTELNFTYQYISSNSLKKVRLQNL